jgi:sialic acid synthase SpsE
LSIVIAEAGTAHLGRLDKAMDLVTVAARAGANVIKFQMFSRDVCQESMFCWVNGDEERVQRWRESALDLDAWQIVKRHAASHRMALVGSVFEDETVDWVAPLGMPFVKVASRAARDFPYDKVEVPCLISLGMYDGPRQEGVSRLKEGSSFLQCEANYPSTAWWEAGATGFSDHSGSPWRGVDALARGCKIVEVHFYVNAMDAGPDLPAALRPEQLKLVCDARRAFTEKGRHVTSDQAA